MTILVLGISGMLGHKVWQRLRARFGEDAVRGAMRGTRAAFSRCELFSGPAVHENVDVRDTGAVDALLRSARPGVVVNCVGVVLRRPELDDAVATIEINSLLPRRLAAWCRRSGSRLIHISTDCVFRGDKGGYVESDPPDALDLYGRSKALGEPDLPGALTLRTSIVGRELRGRQSLLEWFLAHEGGVVDGYRNASWSGVSTLYLADLIGDLLERFPALEGLYHVAGETLSKYELLGHFQRAFGVGVTIRAEGKHVLRRDLDGSRFIAATGIAPPPWREMAASLAADAVAYTRWRGEGC